MTPDYQALVGPSPEDLAGKVKKEFKLGWKPQGGICSFTVIETLPDNKHFYSVWFTQAMIKETQ